MNTALEIARMTKILIVEDEPALVSGLRDNFEFEGYEPRISYARSLPSCGDDAKVLVIMGHIDGRFAGLN